MEINNSFEQEMIFRSYQIFQDNYKNAIRGFQRKISDGKGTKYFINIYHYNHRKQIGSPNIPEGDSYTASVQFDFGNATCNVDYWGTINLHDIEHFFETFWQKMKPEYYEKY